MKQLVAVAAIFFCVSAQAAEPVYKLMDLIGSKDQLNQMSGQMVSVMVQSNPALAPHEDVLRTWANKHFTWDAMKDDMATIYKKYFTDAEIEKLIEFYSTPVGAKAIEVMPQLFQEGSQVGMRIAQENQGELMQMLEKAQAESEGTEEP
ncbi:DUF2059 domain-containing protein [Gilvimarinus algae]|uniref:DUF2059 domain-containing protein n=1 Tax=Gilvimarinus algae TaxID=3058037 RepID=A0ABT8TCV3_9GAMM|nr:DUF2059 domain-containing protein [Gilvimarinus sp. SDUM040014]MDO3381414.1 DUF2059 domain-containing protein [Gilvimarinus sp. SDUM040014]